MSSVGIYDAMMSMPPEPDPLRAVLRLTEIHDAVADAAEVGVDALIRSDIWTAVPIVSQVRAFGRGIAALHDSWVDRKLIAVLEVFEDATPADYERWRERLDGESDNVETGERIVAVLGVVTSTLKARLVGLAFRRYLDGACDSATLRRTVEMIGSALAEDLAALLRSRPRNLGEDVYHRLANLGLVQGGAEALTTFHGTDKVAATTEGRLIL